METKYLLGASTAAYQVEGNNKYSDFWIMEHLEHTSFAEKSGDAVDHYHRYEEDIKLMKKAGMNAFRFSIEWSRIEPEKVVEYFKNYCVYVVEQLGDLMEYVCTINEANMRLQMASVMRTMAQNMGINLQVGVKLELPEEIMVGQREACAAFGGVEAVNTFQTPCTDQGDLLIMKAHEAARDAMKAVCPDLKVGLTLSLHDIQPVEGGEAYAEENWKEEFTHYLPYIEKDDFFGLQNYTRSIVDANGELPVPEGKPRTQMGYEYYPESLEHVIRAVAKDLHIPILITENGVAASDDRERVAFIETVSEGVKACMQDEIPVIGYLHWSLMDNFEWQLGFSKTFGLIEVDRTTMERKPKESFYKMAEIWEEK